MGAMHVNLNVEGRMKFLEDSKTIRKILITSRIIKGTLALDISAEGLRDA